MMQVDRSQLERATAFVARARARVSEADVAAGAGLDVDTARAALYQLMRRYTCALDVHEDGTLVYDFGQRLRPLHAPTPGERLRALGQWLWRGFSVVYKASLAVVLVAYAVVFVVVLIGAAIAASAASRDERPAAGAFHLVALIFRAIFEFATFSALTYRDTDRHGYPHRRFEPKKPVLPQRRARPHAKSFVASVYDFVLGPARVPVDARAQTREVAAFVRRHGGVLTVADVQALSGMDRARAERFFAAFVAEFDGRAEITDEGVLYARFDELLRSTSREHDEPIVYYWDEYEAPHLLTGNTAGTNLAIAGLAGFNLMGALYVLSLASTAGALGALSGTALLWLGAVPAAIFGLFFALPLVRAPLVWWQNRQQHRHNLRRRLFRAIFGAREDRVELAALVDSANRQATTEEKLDAASLRPLLEETLRQVGSALDVDARDRLVADLERLRAEEQVRAQHALQVAPAALSYTTR